MLAIHPRKLLQNRSKEVAVIKSANKNGRGIFKRWNLCSDEVEDMNAGQNIWRCSRHVPSNNLHNKPIAAA